MKYKKKENVALDTAFSNATKYGFNIKFCDIAIFYKKGFHWEYIKHEDIIQIYRRVEEVISHTSCCAENMDIQKFIVILKSGETIPVHICDGEPRLAENLYDTVMNTWTDIKYGKDN